MVENQQHHLQGCGKWLTILASAALCGLAGCSSDKSPPDDGKDGKAAAVSVKSLSACSINDADAANRFQTCAQEILLSSGLSLSDQESLASCAFSSAVPISSSEDLFEVARATVNAHCFEGSP